MKKVYFIFSLCFAIALVLSMSACKKKRNDNAAGVDRPVITREGPFTFSSIGGEVTLVGYDESLATSGAGGPYQKDTVKIPRHVTRIGDGVFSGKNMEVFWVIEPSQLTTIGANAFANTPKLNMGALPLSLRTIGAGAFKDAKKLSRLIMNEQMPPTLGANAFENAGAEETINKTALEKNNTTHGGTGSNGSTQNGDLQKFKDALNGQNGNGTLSHLVLIVPQGKGQSYEDAYKNTNLGSSKMVIVEVNPPNTSRSQAR